MTSKIDLYMKEVDFSRLKNQNDMAGRARIRIQGLDRIRHPVKGQSAQHYYWFRTILGKELFARIYK